ncbi:MAG: methyltransferase domain-containing protein [Candidatus Dormiibacterota bacterium]
MPATDEQHPIQLPPVLSAGGTWHWPGATIDWTFELGDGWDVDEISNVLLVPFVGEQIVLIRLPQEISPVGGTLEPGEHWCVTATRELLEEAGARHRRVVAWCEVELVGEPTMPPGGEKVQEVLLCGLDDACRLVPSEVAALFRLAVALRDGGIDDVTWTRDSVRLLEEHYLRSSTAEGQSGKLGDAADWERSRRLVVDALSRDGTFLDIGCANGLLMESVTRWAASDGRLIEPYGLDASERLVELARRRLPRWHGRFFVGDALTWRSPRRFDFVHTMIDVVPARHRPEWLRHVLTDIVAPGGRLIVRDYQGIGDRMRAWGLPVTGVTVRERVGRLPQEAAWLEAR